MVDEGESLRSENACGGLMLPRGDPLRRNVLFAEATLGEADIELIEPGLRDQGRGSSSPLVEVHQGHA